MGRGGLECLVPLPEATGTSYFDSKLDDVIIDEHELDIRECLGIAW